MVSYRKISNYYTICLVFLFLANYFFSFDPTYILVGSLTFAYTLFILPSTTGLSRVFSVGMLTIGAIILIYLEKPWIDWAPMFTQNMVLVILILFVPVLTIPLRIGKYHEEVKNLLMKYSDKPQVLYAGITSTVFILGSFINLGSLSIVHSVVDKNNFKKALLGKAYVRGFSSVIIWSPFFATVFLILFSLDLSIGSFLLYSFLLGLVQLIVANIWFHVYEKKLIGFELRHVDAGRINYRKISKLVLIVVILIVIILITDRLIEQNMSLYITLIVVFYSVVWSFLIGKIVIFKNEAKQFLNSIIPGRANEVVLFLAAGFFSKAIAETTFGDQLQGLLIYLGERSILLVIFTIISFTACLAFLGIHQIVSISAMLASVAPAEIGFSNVIFALILTASWSVSTLISPTTPANVISSNLLNVKITELVKWNFPFAIIMICLYSVLIYLYYLVL